MAISMAMAKNRKVGEQESQDVEQGSPKKTVLGSLAMTTGDSQHSLVTSKNRSKVVSRKPDRVEDVPFRRQDRRILNARNRRLMDRKLIVFIVTCGLLMICLGGVLIVIYSVYQEDYQYIRPFIIIGPVLVGGGLVALLFSLEVCLRLFRAYKRVQDPDLDNLINPHEVKHWMDPRIIPFGWGLFTEDDEVLVIEKDSANPSLGGARPVSSHDSVTISSSHLEDLIKDQDMGDMMRQKGIEKENEDQFLTEDSPHRYEARGSGDV